MYLSELKIKNFRQFGAGEPAFSVQFHEGVTARNHGRPHRTGGGVR